MLWLSFSLGLFHFMGIINITFQSDECKSFKRCFWIEATVLTTWVFGEHEHAWSLLTGKHPVCHCTALMCREDHFC